ncbi:hypothetical protein MOV08_38005 [Streptomyces yunnanensis]|uniref:DUF5666 domain-containing protein n=1 Tax=Streptomyces yunnanensis TaxID=156453 RepID=A0ABY8AHL7_9ACTN|nr:hypothetical protein [Streptomyces yunnanensis]WEB44514.1 hypothetical protein MOV08_38005 [Streptomyces yunnanensis]
MSDHTMSRSSRTDGRRTRRGRLLPVTALALAALLPAAGSVAAQPLPQPRPRSAGSAVDPGQDAQDPSTPLQGAPPAIPQARAYDKNNKPMASVAPVLRYCNKNPKGCDFKMTRALPLQFTSVVKSLGNAVINCTNKPITVERTVQLQTGSQDNLGGEITGSIALEGHINASGEVSAGVNGEGNVTAKTPDMSKGPMAEAGAKAGANASGKVGGEVGLKATFSGAFKLHYQRTWTTTHTESTMYRMEVKSGDTLVFAANAAMERIFGILTTNNGQRITNVIVDAPSSINSSSFIARTDTTPGGTCNQLRP